MATKSYAARLSPDAILRAPRFHNCVQEYQLDLRNAGVQIIENLGVTENQFDSLDLSDNAIGTLDGFPKLTRLRSLYLANNRISRLSGTLGESLPNLEWLILTNNRVGKFAELDKCLRGLGRLTYLSLLDNPISGEYGDAASHTDYRLFVVSRCPQLKMLDFRKVEVAEREAAKAWVSKDPMELDRKIGVRGSSKRKMSEDGDGEGPDAVAAQTTRKQPSKERLMAIKAAIAGAATLDEVERLERSLMDEAGD
jgi:U2 small nuclear ribonucleoprotein A'